MQRPASERRMGRPSAEGSEALDGLILETAIRLFTEKGYAGTSMEQVAALTGAGKQTIYRRYASKEDLFKAVLSGMGQHLMMSIAVLEQEAMDPLSKLYAVSRALLDMICRQDVIDVYRILIAEAPRFPDLVEHIMSVAVQPLDDVILRLIADAVNAGRINSSASNYVLAQALLGLITGTPLKQALLGDRAMFDNLIREQYLDQAWLIFMNGVSGVVNAR